MPYSTFGNKFTQHSGITELMEDLNAGVLAGDDVLMLGGGNPARIPEIQQRLTEIMQTQLSNGQLMNTLANYDGPQGKNSFIDALVVLFNDLYDWGLTSDNIMLSNGSQNAFFYIFNLLAGDFGNGIKKKILLPLAPEYIGYTDTCITEDAFVALKPKITKLDNGFFKYHIDFDKLKITDEIGAICVSRPTNPTGNVLTDIEVSRLDKLARAHNIPLIIDNAYGSPFPNIIFKSVLPLWNENTILCFSLSKFGLPGARCGIVIAKPSTIKALSSFSAVMALAPGGIGPEIVRPLVESKEILGLSDDVIKPYYYKKSQQAIIFLQQKIKTPKMRIHQVEGSLFLWLWFDDLPIHSKELYKRLKEKGLLIVSGHYFFPGLSQDWKHTQQCIRLNYAQDKEIVRRGIDVLADEINALYA
ncbi:valine--pyruvate transaminase [Psychromonas sp. CNPT3]|uniref:valine--pyruvate transaminase n=1 Tax=Psychromonas sp. CNPT3 TaxID=314282 RepID=UPI00006E7910|nr:valine--pyruvate transaminase [Psychromonas sp. CNPT3]AGH79948.1 valine--pyruvate transaminase [Psychromonas sp. CNPT3]